MRLLMVNPFYEPYLGGTEKHVVEVSERLAKKMDVTVLTAHLPGTLWKEEKNGVKIERNWAHVFNHLPYPLPPPIPFAPFTRFDLRREAKKHDVVHFHNRFVYGPLDGWICRRTGARIGLTLHNARPQGINWLTDALGQAYDDVFGKRLMRSCDFLGGVSQATLDSTIPGDCKAKAKVIYNGVDTKLFNPKVKPDAARKKWGLGERVVLTNCRLVEQKGVEYLLEAMRGVEGRLVVFGRGPLENELRQKAKALKLDALFISERISDELLASLYAACDVFALPSLYEPFGMVLVEAMACGKPCVGTDAGGIPEIITKETGFVSKKKDAGQMRDKIKLLLDDKRKARGMGAAGRRRAAKRFTWDETAQAYLRLYGQA